MARISIRAFDWSRDYYAYVRIGGFEGYSGRFRAWKLYSLTSDAVKTLSQNPDEVEALFETQEELETYLASLRQQTAQGTGEPALHTIGTAGGDKLIISSTL